jgi:tRNA/tmRNA/rRNA uracil-C5-methylase (TrmA/RlmC/RlmD family)
MSTSKLSLFRASSTVQVVLVWNADHVLEAQPTLSRLVKALRVHTDVFHSLWLNLRSVTVGGNSILNYNMRAWRHLHGLPYVKERIGAVEFYFGPQIFRQANLELFEAVVEEVRAWTPLNSVVCELYSGVGVLGLNLAAQCAELHCSDSNEFLKEPFRRSLQSLPKVSMTLPTSS